MQQKYNILFLSTLLFATFIAFSLLVSREIFANFDFASTVRLQNYLPRKFDFPFSVLSILGSFELTLLFLIGLLLFLKRVTFAFFTLFVFFFGLTLEFFGKILLFHPSPPFFLYRGTGFLFPTSYIHTNYSYPSGHVFRISFIITLLLMLSFFKIIKVRGIYFSLILGVFLFFMLLSRVYLGEHWLTDVVGGTLLGSSFGVLSVVFIDSKVKN